MKKWILALLLAISLAPAASFAQVVVRIGPPAPIVERRPVPSRPRVRLDRRLSPLGRWPLRLDPRPLGPSTPSRHALGSSSLGTSPRRLRLPRRPLALSNIFNPQKISEATSLAYLLQIPLHHLAQADEMNGNCLVTRARLQPADKANPMQAGFSPCHFFDHQINFRHRSTGHVPSASFSPA